MNLQEFRQQQAEQLSALPQSFFDDIAEVEQDFFNRVNDALSELTRKGGFIDVTDDNIKLADDITDSLPALLKQSGYYAAITDYVETFAKQKALIDDYFKSNFDDSKSEFANAVFEQTKRNAIEILSSSTPTTGFLQGLRSQIDIAVQSGQSFVETVKQLRTYATGDKISPGAQYGGRDKPGGKLLQYSKQISYDAIAVSDRAYTNVIASELESEWYFYGGGVLPTSRKFCLDRVGKYFHYKEIEKWADEVWGGKAEGTNAQTIFVLLGGHNCQHTLIPVSIDQVPADVVERNIANGNFKPNKQEQQIIDTKPEPGELNEQEQQEYKEFPRDETLTGSNAEIQDASIKYFIQNKDDLVIQYLKESGNVANTDEARKLFDVVGYTGQNANAVHEAASALNKLVQQRLIETGKMNQVVMYAGGAGSGKTTAISSLFKDVKRSADVIIDGNMATFAKSIKQIDGFLERGKAVDILYVYRDPVDAWVNGVIKRMLDNVAERGRIVPLRVFLENTEGSYNTIKGLLKLSDREGVNISLIDNSLGRGNTALMSREKFDAIEFGSSLKNRLIDETQKLLDTGKITKAQFDALING